MIRATALPPAAVADDGAIWNALSDLVTETMMFHRQWARRQGLTPLQFMVLKTLQGQGPLQPSQIADQFGISRSAVSSEINVLEAGGWIARTHPVGNRRTRLTSLTPRAVRVLAAAIREYQTELARGVSEVPAAQRAELTNTITGLVAQLRRLRDTAEPMRRRKAGP